MSILLWILATAGSFAALLSIYLSWKRQTTPLLYLGGALFCVSCVVWSIAQGWQYGLFYAFCLPGILVWAMIALNQSWLRPPSNMPLPRRIQVNWRQSLLHLTHYVVVLVILLIVSLVLTLSVCRLLPFETPGQLAMYVILLPLVWGAAIYHYLAARQKVRTLLYYVGFTALGLISLLWLPAVGGLHG